MASTILRGVQSTLDAYFYEDNGTTPQFVVGGVSYTITAFNNMTIASGIAEQDVINPARWKLTFTIPLSAPLTGANDLYTLLWRAKRQDGGYNQQKDSFTVIDPEDASDPSADNATIALAGEPFTVALKIPDNNISNMSLRIIRADSEMPTVTLTGLVDPAGEGIQPRLEGNLYAYQYTVTGGVLTPIVAAMGPSMSGGMALWYAYYNYVDSYGQEQVQINPIYVVNNTLIFIMDAINKYCNMLRNQDVVTSLRITETTLIHFAIQGLLRLNGTSPANFGFDFNTLNQWNGAFKFWAIKCAQFELLSAMYLGEGMSAFEFSGMTVQLNSDRTQYLTQAMSVLEQDIQTQLPKVKSQYGRAGGGTGRMGTINIHLGPSTNFMYNIGGLGGKWNGNAFPTNSGMPFLPFLR